MNDETSNRNADDGAGKDFRTLEQMATELSMSVPEMVALVEKLGFGLAAATTRFPAGQAEQIMHFVRRSQELAKQIDRADLPSPTRTIDEVLEGPASALMVNAQVVGIGSGVDLHDRPFIRVYTAVPCENVQGLPPHIEGYILVLEHVGAVHA